MSKVSEKVTPEVIEHCRVYKNPDANMIVAVSSYAGKTVRGIAKCHPNDSFDEEFGKKLAVARCNLKVAKKRQARADRKVREALVEQYEVESFLLKMKDYQRRASLDLSRLSKELAALEEINV